MTLAPMAVVAQAVKGGRGRQKRTGEKRGGGRRGKGEGAGVKGLSVDREELERRKANAIAKKQDAIEKLEEVRRARTQREREALEVAEKLSDESRGVIRQNVEVARSCMREAKKAAERYSVADEREDTKQASLRASHYLTTCQAEVTRLEELEDASVDSVDVRTLKQQEKLAKKHLAAAREAKANCERITQIARGPIEVSQSWTERLELLKVDLSKMEEDIE